MWALRMVGMDGRSRLLGGGIWVTTGRGERSSVTKTVIRTVWRRCMESLTMSEESHVTGDTDFVGSCSRTHCHQEDSKYKASADVHRHRVDILPFHYNDSSTSHHQPTTRPQCRKHWHHPTCIKGTLGSSHGSNKEPAPCAESRESGLEATSKLPSSYQITHAAVTRLLGTMCSA